MTTSSLFCALVTIISCCIPLVHSAPSFKYSTVSWRQLSVSNNTGTYNISHCAGFSISDYPPVKLGDVLTQDNTNSAGVGELSVGNIESQVNCTVTNIYIRQEFICCGFTLLTLSRASRRDIAYRPIDAQNGGSITVIPANPNMTQSPRFIDVAFQGLFYINDTLNEETPLQLPLASQETTDPLTCSTLQYEVLFKSVIHNGGAAIISRLTRTPPLDNLFTALFTCRDEFGASAELLVQMTVPSDQTKINHPPQLSNTTQELRIITQSKLFLQQQNHSFIVGAFDVDGDPVDLLPSNVTWPIGATITRLFTPYILPNRTSNNCTGIANVTDVICVNTTLPPEYTDVGIARINTTSLFQIDWTPTPEQALANKIWNLCYRAQDTRGQVSLEETCLFLYVPRPCPAIPTPGVNSHTNLTYVSPVSQSPNVTGSIATWKCDPKYGIYTNDRDTNLPGLIIRESASQFSVQCLASGSAWNDTTRVTCRALCHPDEITVRLRHGSLSRSTNTIAPESVTYTCESGFQPNTTQSSYKCHDEGFFIINDEQYPQCIPVPCPSLHIDQGTYTLINGTDNTTAIVTCNAGYSLNSAAPALCSTQGTWTSIPSCVANPCQFLTLPPYALNLEVQNYTNGIATIECPINWNLQGNNHVTCKTDGSWEAWNVTCIPRCRVSDRLPTGPSGQVLNLPADITYVDVGTTVRYGCSQSNLEYIGASEFTCTSQVTNSLGTFSGTSGICTAVCLRSELPSVNNTKYYIASSILGLNMTVGSEFSASKGPAGITVYSVCQAGSSEGVATYTCNNGAWSIPQACSVTCTLPDIPNINPASLLNSYPAPPYRYLIANQSITLSCADQYSFPGGNSHIITCQLNGILSSSIPTCTRVTPTTCPAITLPPNVIPPSINATAINTNIDISCITGYTLQGNITKVTCLDDYTWTSYQSIQCILDTNSNATAPTNPPPTCCENDTSLSTPAKIMIIFGIILGVLIGIAVIIITVMCRRKRAYVGRVSKMEGPYGEKSAASPAAAAGASDIEFVDVVNGASAIQRSQAPEPILPPNVDDDYVHIDRSEAQHEHIQIDVMADEKSAEGAPRG